MHPTILIGLDGATFTVLDSLMAQGQMPALQAFMARGVRAELLTTPHPLTPPAWTTLMTGRSPGNHGIFDFLRAEIRPNGAFFTLNNFRDIQCETIWSIASREGGRITSLNFPLMAPPPPLNGFIVPGILSWRHLRRNVHPPELYETLKSLPNFSAQEISFDFEKEKKALHSIAEEELDPWVRFHIVREKHWFNIVQRLMETEPCDLTAVMFDGVDKLQHGCWRFLDPAFVPAHPNEFERHLIDLCLQYFRHVDDFIGQIVRMGGPQARVFIASDHGFGPNTHIFRVNKWLEQQGYLRWHKNLPAGGLKSTSSPYMLFDWEKTTAYAQSAATNGIHIRVQQKPGDVGVPPDEYESFRNRLIDQLMAIRVPDTHQRLLKAVLKREEAFPGMHPDKCPDLTLVQFDHGFVSVLDAEPIIAARPAVTGTHYPDGVLMATGPGVAKGKTLARQSIVDMAPTLLYSLGLPVPADFEGQVIDSLFEPAYLKENPPQLGAPTEPPSSYAQASPASESQDDEVIFNRLRALGYVE
jgi:predicted AlkP superfamily phosphohydrolase/phosphomutase